MFSKSFKFLFCALCFLSATISIGASIYIGWLTPETDNGDMTVREVFFYAAGVMFYLIALSFSWGNERETISDLQRENQKLKDVAANAEILREMQRAYLANREAENAEVFGRLVGYAAQKLDEKLEAL